MEQFTLLEGEHTLKESREYLNNALLTVRSLSSGTAFPTTELTDGMLCYRTDLGRLYQLTDAASGVWTDKLSANIGGTSDKANAVAWANVTDKPTAYPAAEHTHPYAGASTAGGSAASAVKLATARTINGISFDGTKNITIVNKIEQGGTGAATAANARNNLGLNLATYTSWAQLGLDNTATFADILDAMPSFSTLTLWVNPGSGSSSPVTNLELPTSGILEIKKTSSNELGGTLLCSGGVMYNVWYRKSAGQIEWTKITEDTDTSKWTLSKGGNGYARDTSTGFTIQWGYVDTTTSSSGTITFPKAFTGIYNVTIQEESSEARSHSMNSMSNTGFNYYLGAKDKFRWLAIGYCAS